MLGLIDTATVAISVRGIDLIALKKLSLVSHALAEKIGGWRGRNRRRSLKRWTSCCFRSNSRSRELRSHPTAAAAAPP